MTKLVVAIATVLIVAALLLLTISLPFGSKKDED